MSAEPEDQMAAAAARRSRLRASHADREHVIDMLKAAYAHGGVTKHTTSSAVGQAFASRTYAEPAVVTADSPIGRIVDQLPSKPVQTQARPPTSHAARLADA